MVYIACAVLKRKCNSVLLKNEHLQELMHDKIIISKSENNYECYKTEQNN